MVILEVFEKGHGGNPRTRNFEIRFGWVGTDYGVIDVVLEEGFSVFVLVSLVPDVLGRLPQVLLKTRVGLERLAEVEVLVEKILVRHSERYPEIVILIFIRIIRDGI